MRPFLAGLLAFIALVRAQEVQFHVASEAVVRDRLHAFVTKNPERESALRRLFEEAGCKGDDLVEQKVNEVKSPNLVCTDPGASGSTIIVGAHFDLAERGQGVVDNWTGAALLPSLYQGLADLPRQHTYVFVGFTAEEQGLIGSRAFVKQLGPNHPQIKAMVNIDTLGLSDTKIWLSHSDKELARWVVATAQTMKLPIEATNVEEVGSADSESFREKKIPAITIHSVTQETLKILHSPSDTIESVNCDQYYRTYRLVLAYLAVLYQKFK
jgi:Zn-dependent M28 family amino/carboxypeptidase